MSGVHGTEEPPEFFSIEAVAKKNNYRRIQLSYEHSNIVLFMMAIRTTSVDPLRLGETFHWISTDVAADKGLEISVKTQCFNAALNMCKEFRWMPLDVVCKIKEEIKKGFNILHAAVLPANAVVDSDQFDTSDESKYRIKDWRWVFMNWAKMCSFLF